MSNVPPPDPNSSKLGMDEWIGIIVTFTTIGAILIAILGNKEKGFNLKLGNLGSNSEPKTQIRQIPTAPKPSVTEKASEITEKASETNTTSVTKTPSETNTTLVTKTPSEINTTSGRETPEGKLNEISGQKVPDTSNLLPTRQNLAEGKLNDTSRGKPVNSVPSGAIAEIPTSQPTTTAIAETPASQPTLTSTTTPTPTKTVKFTDVDEKLWATPYIEHLAKHDLISVSNDGTFKPNQSINRAEFSALVQKALKNKQTLEIPPFNDLKQDYWGFSAINESAKNGFLRGYPDKTFKPTQPISRLHVLVALASGLGLKNTNNPDEVLKKYQDGGEVPQYAREKVSAAIEAGIAVNYPDGNLLNLNQNATRAEVAALVYQALVKEGKAEAIPSEYIVKP